MWRLKPILDTLHQRCEVEGRPLRVLSICDGIAGGLAALLQLGGWTKVRCRLFCSRNPCYPMALHLLL